MKISKELLDSYVDSNLLVRNKHPELDLFIYNYSVHTTYNQSWDEITLQCRGLIIDIDGNIVARPFKKFFNAGELDGNTLLKLFEMDYTVFEKLDGSLGILFNYKGNWILSTKGSFQSEQAIEGRRLLEKYNLDKLNPENTYLFEIIYAQNRIVVDYGDFEDLVLLGVINTSTGKEIPFKNIKELGFKLPKVFEKDSLNNLKALNVDNEEGFVLVFEDFSRIKLKFERYVELHKVLTNFSSIDIWKILSSGGDLEDYLENVPDEFYDWVKEKERLLRVKWGGILITYSQLFKKLKETGLCDITKRGEFAMEAKNTPYPSVLFSMLDNKDYSNIIWRIIKPDYELPFKNK